MAATLSKLLLVLLLLMQLSSGKTIPRNQTKEYEPWCREPPNITELVSGVFTWVFWISLGSVSCLCNLLILYAVWKYPNMHTTTNYLIANMAVGDLLSSVWTVFMALYLQQSGHTWTSDNYDLKILLCRLVYCLYYVLMFCSVFSLVIITLDRFMAVTKPLSHKQCTSWAKIAIPIIWLVSTVLPIHYTVTKVNLCPHGDLVFCASGKSEFDAILIVTTAFLLPNAIIFGLYVAIVYKLYTRKVPGEKIKNGKRSSKHVAKRVTLMIVSIFIAFEICWCPLSFGYVLSQMYFDEQSGSYLRVFGYKALMITNGVFNTFIYAIFNQNFRGAFLKTFKLVKNSGALFNRSTSSGSQGTTMTFHTKSSVK